MKTACILAAVSGIVSGNEVTTAAQKWWLDADKTAHTYKNWGTEMQDETVAHFTFDGATKEEATTASSYFVSDPTDLDLTGGLAHRDDAVGNNGGDRTNWIDVKTNFIGDVNQDVVQWKKVEGALGVNYKWDIYVVGECKMERQTVGKFKGNMAWHVTNTGTRTATEVNQWKQNEGNCAIATRELLRIPRVYDACRFSLRVQDLDYHGASKDREDFMCIHPLNANGKLMTDINGDTAATCHFDDHLIPTRRLASVGGKDDLTHNANHQESFDTPNDAGGKQLYVGHEDVINGTSSNAIARADVAAVLTAACQMPSEATNTRFDLVADPKKAGTGDFKAIFAAARQVV
jgi:hypothetical protein